MSRSFRATCRDCGAVRQVRRHETLHAARPRCTKCGGPLLLSAAAEAELADVQARKAGARPQRPSHKRKQPPLEPAPRPVVVAEAGRYEFTEWPDMYRWARHDAERRGQPWPAELTWEAFYGDGGPMEATAHSDRVAAEQGAYASGLIRASEREFYRSGRPYYKIWPAIAGALCDTEMRVDGEFFRMPFPAIEVRFPHKDNPLEQVGAALLARTEAGGGHEDGREWSLLLVTFDGLRDFWNRDDGGQYWVADIPIRRGLLLEDALSQTRLMEEAPNPDLMRRLMRVAVGVCFFGVDNHEVILPDLPRRLIDRHSRERGPTPTQAAKDLAQAKRDGLFGWKVGSEMALPTARVHHHDQAEQPGGEHRELSTAHVRRGHMRMQPHGEARGQRKLIFVPPCIVRPDLPLASTHGYRVKVPKGVRWAPERNTD